MCHSKFGNSNIHAKTLLLVYCSLISLEEHIAAAKNPNKLELQRKKCGHSFKLDVTETQAVNQII